MSDKIFPADIINHTVENHFVVNNKRFNRVYIGVIALLLIGVFIGAVVADHTIKYQIELGGLLFNKQTS